jgi:hypothetical protein
MKTLLLTLIAAFACAGVALAQDAPASPHHRERATIQVTVKTRLSALAPITTKRVTLPQDVHGRTQRHHIQPRAKVPLTVTYPDARPGDEVIIQALDGGTLANGQMAMRLTLDGQCGCEFTFEALAGQGVQRILVRKGRDEKLIDLWVGNRLPVREETESQP